MRKKRVINPYIWYSAIIVDGSDRKSCKDLIVGCKETSLLAAFLSCFFTNHEIGWVSPIFSTSLQTSYLTHNLLYRFGKNRASIFPLHDYNFIFVKIRTFIIARSTTRSSSPNISVLNFTFFIYQMFYSFILLLTP